MRQSLATDRVVIRNRKQETTTVDTGVGLPVTRYTTDHSSIVWKDKNGDVLATIDIECYAGSAIVKHLEEAILGIITPKPKG